MFVLFIRHIFDVGAVYYNIKLFGYYPKKCVEGKSCLELKIYSSSVCYSEISKSFLVIEMFTHNQ